MDYIPHSASYPDSSKRTHRRRGDDMTRCGSSTACTMLTPRVTDAFAGGRFMLPAFCPSSRCLFPTLSRLEQDQQQLIRGRAAAAGTSPLAARSISCVGVTRMRRGRSELLRCGLTRLSADAGHKVLPVLATRDQWSHYWGGSDVQRVGKFFEVTAVAFLGLWACYFASFFLGVATMTVIGTSFLFYWLLAPNVTSFRRNRALRGRIAPFPGAEGNSIAIFRARVVGVTEEYHPVTGQPVFLRMVIEDEDGRALKFRTRTKREYARVRPGMVAEAVLVSPDARFEEILGVSDTFIPAANVWVGEYPYLDKVVMRRLLASRDLKREQRRRRDSAAAADAAAADGSEEYGDYDDYDEDEELDPMTYRDSWTQTRLREDATTGNAALPPDEDSMSVTDTMPGFDAYYGESEDEEPYFEGVGSSGFSGVAGVMEAGGDAERAEMTADDSYRYQQKRRQKQWERVSGTPRPRRRPPAAGSRTYEADGDGGGEYDYGGRRVRGEAGAGRSRGGGGDVGTTPFDAGDARVGEYRMAAGHKRGGRR